MSVPSPWSVKGVQPKAREAAKDLARREGLTLGEWLNRLIGDVDEDGDVVASRENTPAYAPQATGQAYQPDAGYAPQQAYGTQGGYAPAQAFAPQPQYPQPQLSPTLAPFPNASASPAAGWPPRESDNSRLTAALEQLTRRLDGSTNPNFAPQAQPQPSLNDQAAHISTGLIDRMEAGERRTETALGRVDASLSDVRQTQAALNERLRAMESNDPNHKSLVALRGLETALGRLSQQVFEAEERSQALEGRIDEKLAEATAKLGADTGISDRVGQLEQVTNEAMETLDTSVSLINQRLATTEAVASDTSARLADAMIDLSARLTGVEQHQDDTTFADRVGILGERLDGMEDVTTQAIESVDKGLGIVSQRVAATEALAQATNERLVEALIDLSARLVQLENIDTQEEARELLSALEAKNKELTRRLETLDNKIDATRSELGQEVKTAIAAGVDGRMAEIAKALADRLDVSERRNGEALERIGAEMARASISLDQRLREIEERGTVDIAAAMRNEMAQMGRAIDDRMASMERRDAAALDQAGGHLQQLAQTLTDKLDASEARAQNAVQNVSSQMEQLAQRLQARQDETAQNLVSRMEDGEARSHHDLQSSLAQIAQEIRAAEDRAKAVSAPLHRDFNSMIDRLDQVEANSVASYAEPVLFGDEVVTVSPQGDYNPQAAFEMTPERGADAFEFDAPQQVSVENDVPRRTGFGAPFPGSDGGALSGARQSDVGLASLGSGYAAESDFDEDPFSMETAGLGGHGGTASKTSAFDEFADDLSETWSEPSRTSRGSNDYLTNARNAASRAALESQDLQKLAKKKPTSKANAKKTGKASTESTFGLDVNKTEKAKAKLSPVGIAAAAALVATTGILALKYFTADNGQNEMPAALNAAVAPAAAPLPVQSAGTDSQATSAAPVTAPVAAPSPIAEAAPQAVLPAALPTTPKATPTISAAPKPVYVPTPKSPAVKAAFVPPRAKITETPVPSAAPRPAVQVRPQATVSNASPVRVPFGQTAPPPSRPVAVPQIAVPKANANVSNASRPAQVATNQPRVAPPRVAVAGARPPATSAATPISGGNARQLYDQAIAKQQAGDAAGAAALMRAAADTGDARSINRLAKMYERGEGVTRDAAQARALTERAAARGSSQAMHNLGVYYAEGEGPARDMNKAADSFRRAANRGVTDSQFNLGAMAEQGLGVQRSDREAYYWYSVAGRNGDRDAAAKSRELASRLPAAEKAAEDQRAAQFRAEAGGDD